MKKGGGQVGTRRQDPFWRGWRKTAPPCEGEKRDTWGVSSKGKTRGVLVMTRQTRLGGGKKKGVKVGGCKRPFSPKGEGDAGAIMNEKNQHPEERSTVVRAEKKRGQRGRSTKVKIN